MSVIWPHPSTFSALSWAQITIMSSCLNYFNSLSTDLLPYVLVPNSYSQHCSQCDPFRHKADHALPVLKVLQWFPITSDKSQNLIMASKTQHGWAAEINCISCTILQKTLPAEDSSLRSICFGLEHTQHSLLPSLPLVLGSLIISFKFLLISILIGETFEECISNSISLSLPQCSPSP